MTIRRAARADADGVTEVFIASRATLTFLPELHTEDEHRAFIAEVVIGGQEVWIAEVEARIVGFAALSECRLEHLYVHPRDQRQGIGTGLLAKAKERCPHGFDIWVFQQNAAARRFYETHGARLVEVTDGSGNEERTPDARYEWRPPVSAAG